jgi:hypothetical protein
MTAKLLLVSTIIAMGALALGYGLIGLWVWTMFIVTLGLVWLIGQRRDWGWMASVGLVLFVSTAAFGLWLGAGTGWMLIGVVAALSAWDLDHFTQRLSGAGRVESARDLERRHLQRLLTVDVSGLVLAIVALGIKVEFGLGTATLLGLLVILGLSRMVGFLRRKGN